MIGPSATVTECIDNETSLKHLPFNLKHKLNVLDHLEPHPPEDEGEDNEIWYIYFLFGYQYQLTYCILVRRDSTN